MPSDALAVANRLGMPRIAPAFSRVSSSAVGGRWPDLSARSSRTISISVW